MMGPEQRSAIRARLDAFAAKCGYQCVWYANNDTPPNLILRGNNDAVSLMRRPYIGEVREPAAAEFLCSAPNDIRDLLTEVSNLKWRTDSGDTQNASLRRKVQRLERELRRAKKGGKR